MTHERDSELEFLAVVRDGTDQGRRYSLREVAERLGIDLDQLGDDEPRRS